MVVMKITWNVYVNVYKLKACLLIQYNNNEKAVYYQ